MFRKREQLIPCLHEGTFHGGRRKCDVILDVCVLTVSDSQESFKPEGTVVPRLHDVGHIAMSFRTGTKISLQLSYRGLNLPRNESRAGIM